MEEPTQQIEALLKHLDEQNKLEQTTHNIEEFAVYLAEKKVINLQEVLRQTDAATLDLLIEEMIQLRKDDDSFKGVLSRLTSAIAPDLPHTGDEITSYKQAIDNLDRYGEIIPSSQQVALANVNLKKSRAWQIFWQAIAKLVVIKLGEYLFKNQDKKTDADSRAS
jgi:hypothetical protein